MKNMLPNLTNLWFALCGIYDIFIFSVLFFWSEFLTFAGCSGTWRGSVAISTHVTEGARAPFFSPIVIWLTDFTGVESTHCT